MVKKPNLSEYDGKGDPDEHMQVVNERVNYFKANSVSQCNLLAMTLIVSARLCIIGLLDGSI